MLLTFDANETFLCLYHYQESGTLKFQRAYVGEHYP